MTSTICELKLVVDAGILHSAGVREVTDSKICRYVLMDIRDYNHAVVQTKDIENEYKRHASKFSKIWLGAMKSKGKLIRILQETKNYTFRDQIHQHESNMGKINAMIKDALLVEAAVIGDRLIISPDKKSKRYFSALSAKIPILSSLFWEIPNSRLIWLETGNIDALSPL